ncbi:MAG: DNA-directed RNA polymerase subunit alpha C-terminal domain-containing protein [Neisseriaceae bacterium]|nr:hypothetical protein [Neisseriaceae bacterium]
MDTRFWEWVVAKIVSIVGIDSSIVALREDGSVWQMALEDREWQPFPKIVEQKDPGVQVFLQQSIGDLAISGRAKCALRRSNIYQVQELAALSESELRALPSIGDKSIYEIKQVLAAKGIFIQGV